MTRPTDDELEAVERLAKSLAFVANRTGMTVEKCEEVTDDAAAMLRALSAERDELKQSLEKAVMACGEQARARGEAEGKLAASEMAGVVEGWKARAEAAEAERDEALNQLDSSRHSVDVLESRVAKLKTELAEAVGVLQNIESRPCKMTWGEDYEVSEAMRDMEETASAFLARHHKEADR